MNRKNIVALFLIVCIVFINIEIKVQAEVIDGKIDWESATILTIYDEKIFFSIYDKITDRTVYFQYNVESDKCNKIGEIDNQEISSGDIAYNNDAIFFWISKKKERNIYNAILYSLDLKRSELKPITAIEVNQPLIYVEYLDGVISYIGKIYGKYGKGILYRENEKRQANIVKNYNNKNNKGEFIEQFTVDQELIYVYVTNYDYGQKQSYIEVYNKELKKIIAMRIGAFVLLLIIFFSCQVPKEKMTGRNIRLWQDTPGWKLAKAVRSGDTIRINEILLRDSIDIDYREPIFGQSLLFWAIWHNKTEMVQFLLSKGADPNMHDYFNGQSPVVLASSAYGEDIEILRLLLKYGGDPNDCVSDSDSVTYMRSIETPLICAASDNIEKVELLIKAGADVNLAIEPGYPPLHNAIIGNRANIVRYLLIEQNADFHQVYTVTIQGDTLDFEDLLSKSMMERVENTAKELPYIYKYLEQFK